MNDAGVSRSGDGCAVRRKLGWWGHSPAGLYIADNPPQIYRPFLQVSALRRVTFSLRAQRESNQRESAPDIRVSLRSTPLAPVLFRGSARRAIHGPTCLVWHPCQTPLSTAPPLGLLTGFGDRVVCMTCGRTQQKAFRFAVVTSHTTHRRRQPPHSEDRVESL